MHQFSRFKPCNLCNHINQCCILNNIPIICRKYILWSLIQYSIQAISCYIKCHPISTRIQIHLMKILVYIHICHHTTTVWIMFQIINQAIHLVKHTFFVLVFYTHLISVSFSDRTIFICPAIPDMTFQIMYIIGFFLPDPQYLIYSRLNICLSKCNCRKFLWQIIAVYDAKLFDRVSTCSILPLRADFFSLCTISVFYDWSTHFYKNIIRTTHFIPPFFS